MSSPGDEPRILLDPEDLKRVAVRMRGASVMLSFAGRELVTRPMPPMPPGLAPELADIVARANGELQDVALELARDAGSLAARATWAELGGGGSVAWLIPGLHYLAGSPTEGVPTPASAVPLTVHAGTVRSEVWATELLDEMASSSHGTEAAPLPSDLLDFALDHGVPPQSLGVIEMSAGEGLELYERHVELREVAPSNARATESSGAGDGALGVSLGEDGSALGVGLIGCLIVGGGSPKQGGSSDASLS